MKKARRSAILARNVGLRSFTPVFGGEASVYLTKTEKTLRRAAIQTTDDLRGI